MKKERKELAKQFKEVIEDLLDNYDQYTDEEKQKIKDVFKSVAELNGLLDKYDVERKTDWSVYYQLCNKYLDGMGY